MTLIYFTQSRTAISGKGECSHRARTAVRFSLSDTRVRVR